MIVPQTRLLFWFAAVVLPFAVLGALYPEASLVSICLVALLPIAALADAAVSYGALEGISLKLPELLRFSKDREGLLPLTVQNQGNRALRLRLGLPLPAELRSSTAEAQVFLPGTSQVPRLEMVCTPLKRGSYRLRHVHLETSSRLGFWAVRGLAPVRCEVRVYPNLGAERKNLAALFLHRGNFGVHAQRQVGKGRDFEKLREYIHGDSFDEIHWKATAKRGHPVTKVFQIERTQEVYVIIDASRLSGREAAPGSGFRVPSSPDEEQAQLGTQNSELRPSVLERFITAALILGLAAEQQGDLFGLVTFADKVEAFLRAKNGQAHYSACRDALYTLEPRSVSPDFDELAAFLRLRLRRRALLLFLTALDDPVLKESFVRNIGLLGRQHLVLVNMLKPVEAEPLFGRAEVNCRDDLYRRLGGHLQWHDLRELGKTLQRRGVSFHLLENERLCAELVGQYLNVKRRQVL